MKRLTMLFLAILMCAVLANAGDKPKISISVFTNQQTCWTCFRSLNTYSNMKLDNCELEMTVFFCNEDDTLLASLMKEYELNVKATIDPECLYAKKYGITRLPGIVIKDKDRDSILLAENWSNPRGYKQLIIEYDKNYKPLVKHEPDYLSPKMIVRDSDGKPIKMEYMYVTYLPKRNEYYAFLQDDNENISVIDSTGKVKETINLLDVDGVSDFYQNDGLRFKNDSILVWTSPSNERNGSLVIYALNINTKKLAKKGLIDSTHTSNNSYLQNFNLLPQSNKLVMTKYYFRHNTLDKNEKLILITDTNFNADKYFGKVDPICEKTTLAANIMTSFVTPAVYNDYIYYLMQMSNQMYIFDSKGSYIKTIELQYPKNYNPPLKDIDTDATVDDKFDIWEKYKMMSNLFVQKDRIILIGLRNSVNEKTMTVDQQYYITVFDMNGKVKNETFALPKNLRIEDYIYGNRLLVTEKLEDGTMAIRWIDK